MSNAFIVISSQHTESLAHLGVMSHKLAILLQGTSDEKSKVPPVLYSTSGHEVVSNSEGAASIVYLWATGKLSSKLDASTLRYVHSTREDSRVHRLITSAFYWTCERKCSGKYSDL
jgi:hypothetical protein